MRNGFFRKYICILTLLLQSLFCVAQTDRQYVRNGNKYFAQQNFIKAESEYRKSLAKNPSNSQALYNLGCALMMQKKDSAAILQFKKAGSLEHNPRRRSMVYHNMGFIFQSHKMYGEAVEAYKESLRNNPSDNETRYNLELCKRQKKSAQNKSDKNNRDNKKQNNQNKENKKQDNRQNKSDKNKSQNKNVKMSKDNAEQLLNAAIQEENETRQRVKNAMRNNQSRKLDKNW